ncbi:MAG: GNAT family N-acetyltransferase [Acidimicrobiia bacterium]|nr:GNAT family N-acetyltransferase [Acidimicrobiia bacterium]
MEIVEASGGAHMDQLRSLFKEYWASFGFTPCFQGFETELENLPAGYSALWLAIVDGQAAGCVALRRIDEERAEAKRLWVRPEFRGKGIGRKLLETSIARARETGFKQLVGDTMPVMADALSMYERMGFQRIEPYLANPTPGAICIGYTL